MRGCKSINKTVDSLPCSDSNPPISTTIAPSCQTQASSRSHSPTSSAPSNSPTLAFSGKMVSAKFLVLLLCALAALFAAAPVAEAKGKVMPAICFDCVFLHDITYDKFSGCRERAMPLRYVSFLCMLYGRGPAWCRHRTLRHCRDDAPCSASSFHLASFLESRDTSRTRRDGKLSSHAT